ncbi:hypothetical protein FIBSPDRAFT_1040349 [Athelia psychrophila]|uniref:Uncharacterized protein n=1 Tax=Athelia psychrophila TaxID=1759441 RepID=A0A166QIF6_9AGAM|nr:hypothetical protein FIBSPDRAFT_1040349 [Fibularhizoctonia sp. CBS 109695]
MPEPLAIPEIRVLQNLLHLSPFITDDLRVQGTMHLPALYRILGLFSSGKEDGDTHGTEAQVVHAGANSPVGTRILPTWPMYNLASGGGRPLNLSKNKQQRKLRKATETHRFQNGVRHIAPTIPTPMPRDVIPVCSALNPCLAGKAWNAILGSSACYALRRRVMWS